MKKTISFSLWGSDPKYTVGAIRNAELSSGLYKGWKLKYYIASSVPNQIIYSLEEFSNVEIVEKQNPGDWTSMFWRFEASFDDDSDVIIFRDTDSRLSSREEDAVNEWLAGDKTYHIMRDHPYHKFPILGGMWGLKKSKNYDMKEMIESFMESQASDRYGTDYQFLSEVLFPVIGDDMLVHDEFFDNKPFPSKRKDLEFVGKVFNENEETVQEHSVALKSALAARNQ